MLKNKDILIIFTIFMIIGTMYAFMMWRVIHKMENSPMILEPYYEKYGKEFMDEFLNNEEKR